MELKEELLEIGEQSSVIKLFEQAKRIKFYSGMLTFFIIGTVLGVVGLPILVWVLAMVLMFICFYLTKERRQLEKELRNKVYKHYQDKRFEYYEWARKITKIAAKDWDGIDECGYYRNAVITGYSKARHAFVKELIKNKLADLQKVVVLDFSGDVASLLDVGSIKLSSFKANITKSKIEKYTGGWVGKDLIDRLCDLESSHVQCDHIDISNLLTVIELRNFNKEDLGGLLVELHSKILASEEPVHLVVSDSKCLGEWEELLKEVLNIGKGNSMNVVSRELVSDFDHKYGRHLYGISDWEVYLNQPMEEYKLGLSIEGWWEFEWLKNDLASLKKNEFLILGTACGSVGLRGELEL